MGYICFQGFGFVLPYYVSLITDSNKFAFIIWETIDCAIIATAFYLYMRCDHHLLPTLLRCTYTPPQQIPLATAFVLQVHVASRHFHLMVFTLHVIASDRVGWHWPVAKFCCE